MIGRAANEKQISLPEIQGRRGGRRIPVWRGAMPPQFPASAFIDAEQVGRDVAQRFRCSGIED